jgi:hypothetical protein
MSILPYKTMMKIGHHKGRAGSKRKKQLDRGCWSVYEMGEPEKEG